MGFNSFDPRSADYAGDYNKGRSSQRSSRGADWGGGAGWSSSGSKGSADWGGGAGWSSSGSKGSKGSGSPLPLSLGVGS